MTEILANATKLCEKFELPEVQAIFTDEEKIELQEQTKILRFTKGDKLLVEGDRPKGVYCFRLGNAKLFKVGSTGKEQIIRFIKGGDIVGHRSLICHEPLSASVTAIEDVEVKFVPEKFFIKILKNVPDITFDMLQLMSLQLGQAANAITILAQKTVRERLAEVLIYLEDQLGVDDKGFLNISLTREEMANLIGTATESAIRLISEFKNDDLIEVDGRRIKIINRQKIMKLGLVNR